jgi:hypothetical protein
VGFFEKEKKKELSHFPTQLDLIGPSRLLLRMLRVIMHYS